MNKKYILVTGGAGYIGSATAIALHRDGYIPILFDIRKLEERVPELHAFVNVVGNIRNHNQLQRLFQQYHPMAVVHLAALCSIPESAEKPEQYFETNVMGTVNLLSVMREYACHDLIFSSSCSVYGDTAALVSEQSPCNPLNIYSGTKLTAEKLIELWQKLFGIRSAILRYCNVAGQSEYISAAHRSSIHPTLINILASRFREKKKDILLYGTDYKTRDGTAERDYIHVDDVAVANLKALRHLIDTRESQTFIIGSGSCYSNREIITLFQTMTSFIFTTHEKNRRVGDITSIRADSTVAKKSIELETDKINKGYYWFRNQYSHAVNETSIKNVAKGFHARTSFYLISSSG